MMKKIIHMISGTLNNFRHCETVNSWFWLHHMHRNGLNVLLNFALFLCIWYNRTGLESFAIVFQNY